MVFIKNDHGFQTSFRGKSLHNYDVSYFKVFTTTVNCALLRGHFQLWLFECFEFEIRSSVRTLLNISIMIYQNDPKYFSLIVFPITEKGGSLKKRKEKKTIKNVKKNNKKNSNNSNSNNNNTKITNRHQQKNSKNISNSL